MNANSNHASDGDRSPVAAAPIRSLLMTDSPSLIADHCPPRPLATGRWLLTHFLVFALIRLASAVHGFGAEPVRSLKPVVTTNYGLVTKNMALTTNGLSLARKSSNLPSLSWVPPEDGFDWIQLRSGEWLKGRIKAMQERKLEFDSEELNDLTFDWKDIRQVRSPRILDVLFVGGEQVSGPVTV